jgi:nucleotide sugar dehydrogenase
MKICIIGLGEVGFPTATYIKEQHFETWGYDLNPERVKKAYETGINATMDWNAIPHDSVEAYIICVTTSLGPDGPDMSSVFEVCKRIATSRKAKNFLVSIESTLIVGTCKKISVEIFGSSAKLVHVPHRFWKDDPINHGVKQLRVIGGVNEKSLQKGVAFYTKLGIPLYPVSSVEVAEMCKIVENSHRFLQIAFAEELKMICYEIGLETDELKNALNTKWNVEILDAKDGVGRHCLPKDIQYVIGLTKKAELLKSAVSVDKKYVDFCRKINKARKID